MINIVRHFTKIVYQFIYSIITLIFVRNNLFVTASVPILKNNSNFGDDVSYILVEMLSGKKVIPYRRFLFKKVNIACIGSIIEMDVNIIDQYTIVWGSGLLSPEKNLSTNPLKVHAVRGPLTRKYLLEHNVECPEIFGDPALLLPFIYSPKNISKKYKLGIILHFNDQNNKKLKKKINSYDNTLVIDVTKYGEWTNFIDAILSCEFIISSSLHGVIIADAYSIPNSLCFFGKAPDSSGNFKFRDYFLSVNKEMSVLDYDYKMTLDDLVQYKTKWRKPSIDLNPLINACPFKISYNDLAKADVRL